MTTKQTVLIEYSIDSLGDINASQFEASCRLRAAQLGYDVEFRVGLRNRETMSLGEPSDIIVERAFAACCADAAWQQNN